MSKTNVFGGAEMRVIVWVNVYAKVKSYCGRDHEANSSYGLAKPPIKIFSKCRRILGCVSIRVVCEAFSFCCFGLSVKRLARYARSVHKCMCVVARWANCSICISWETLSLRERDKAYHQRWSCEYWFCRLLCNISKKLRSLRSKRSICSLCSAFEMFLAKVHHLNNFV